MKQAKCADNNRREIDEGESQHQKGDALETLRRGEIKSIELSPPYQYGEDCPVCCVRLPPEEEFSTAVYQPCCGIVLCNACDLEQMTCAFCHTPSRTDDSELVQRYMDRINKDDVRAIIEMADIYFTGRQGVPKNETKALQLFHRAADLGDAKACHRLGIKFTYGLAGCKSTSEGMRYLYMGAKKGDVAACCVLGNTEFSAGNFDTANIHFCSAAKKGCTCVKFKNDEHMCRCLHASQLL